MFLLSGHLKYTCDGIVRVEDLTQFALKLFEIEKKLLLEEKQEYSCAVVIVITPERHYWEEVEFNDETEMDAAYGAIVKRAKRKGDRNHHDKYMSSQGCGRRIGTRIILVGQVGRGKSTKMFVPDYFWAEPKIGKHKPAIFGGKQSGGSWNTDGF